MIPAQLLVIVVALLGSALALAIAFAMTAVGALRAERRRADALRALVREYRRKEAARLREDAPAWRREGRTLS